VIAEQQFIPFAAYSVRLMEINIVLQVVSSSDFDADDGESSRCPEEIFAETEEQAAVERFKASWLRVPVRGSRAKIGCISILPPKLISGGTGDRSPGRRQSAARTANTITIMCRITILVRSVAKVRLRILYFEL
jgi:hypothetical protein